MEQFTCSTRLISGRGSVSYLGEMGVRRLLVVTDPYFAANGQAQRIAALANAEAVEYFDKIQPDPTVELAAEATAVCREFQPDTVVALGGGSTIDCAKAMVYISGLHPRMVVIPTTSGSGSEVTDFAVLTHNGVKQPLVDPRLRPEIALLDSDLLTEMPKTLIADTGFDAISHAVEAYVATGATGCSDALAQSAVGVIYSALSASRSGDLSVRQRIHEASAMAGVAFSSAGLGLCHAMSHAIGGILHIPHGRLNAVLLPAVIRLNAYKCQQKYGKLARFAGFGGSADTLAVRNLCNGLQRLRRELQMPDTLCQAGADPNKLWQCTGSIVSATLADPCCKTNPLLVEDYMVRRILSEVTGRV